MTIEIPDRMKKFPLWKGKYPIHYTVFVEDGIPQFKTLARARQVEAIQKNLCHLCGERMSAPYWFIGGPGCAKSRHFLDGPMHEECARYATKICPFLANPNARYRGTPESTNQAYQIMVREAIKEGTERPTKMFLGASMSYKAVWKGLQFPEFTAGEWVVEDWNAMPQRQENDLVPNCWKRPDPIPECEHEDPDHTGLCIKCQAILE